MPIPLVPVIAFAAGSVLGVSASKAKKKAKKYRRKQEAAKKEYEQMVGTYREYEKFMEEYLQNKGVEEALRKEMPY